MYTIQVQITGTSILDYRFPFSISRSAILRVARFHPAAVFSHKTGLSSCQQNRYYPVVAVSAPVRCTMLTNRRLVRWLPVSISQWVEQGSDFSPLPPDFHLP